jgi:single-strand DNA-binding protein
MKMKNNSCFLIGNLGVDPVERGRAEKTGPIVGFTVAENVQSFDQQTKKYKTVHTNWFQVTTFGSLAERVKTGLKKGDRVAIQGRMKIGKFKDKNGEDRTGFEIIAENVANWHSLPAISHGQSPGEPEIEDDESLPF